MFFGSRDKKHSGSKKRLASGRPGAYSASWEIKSNNGKCFSPGQGPVWLGFAYMAWTGRKTVAGVKNTWPPAGPEPIQPAEKLNQPDGKCSFILPGEKQI